MTEKVTRETSTLVLSPAPEEDLSNNKYVEVFQNSLTKEKILEFNKSFKKEKSEKISKRKFIKKLTELFSTEYSSKNHSLVYEYLFNRFKSVSCNYINKEGNYFITKMQPEEEIDIYEITIALVMFMKDDYETKIKMLFDFSDKDEDGFLNEIEIRRLILTINVIFSEENAPLKTESTLLNHSLIKVKANQILNQLLFYPGGLRNIFIKDKYIDFKTFYSALIKIKDYQYNIIPFYLNLGHSLSLVKTEKKLKIRTNLKDDYLSITNDVLLPIKNFKKVDKLSFQSERFFSERNVINRKKFKSNSIVSHNNENNKLDDHEVTSKPIDLKSNSNTNSATDLNVYNSNSNNNCNCNAPIKLKRKNIVIRTSNNNLRNSYDNNPYNQNGNSNRKILQKSSSCNVIQTLNLNNINSVSPQPFIFEFYDDPKRKPIESLSSFSRQNTNKQSFIGKRNKETSNANKSKFPLLYKNSSNSKLSRNKISFSMNKEKYATYEQMIKEIDYLVNKNKYDTNYITELKNLGNGMFKECKRCLEVLRDKGPKGLDCRFVTYKKKNKEEKEEVKEQKDKKKNN